MLLPSFSSCTQSSACGWPCIPGQANRTDGISFSTSGMLWKKTS